MNESMKPNLDNLLPLDWELGKRLAGNKRDLAEDMLNMLVKNLRGDLNLIKAYYIARKYEDLLKSIHKLHGAVCYCGTPRLKIVIACLETDLKNNIMVGLPDLLKQLEVEVNRVLLHCEI